MEIRPIKHEELNFAHFLTKVEKWGTTRQELEELLYIDPRGFFIANIKNEPVGIVSSINYGSFGFIGNLIVLKNFRNQEIGIKLMKFAIKNLKLNKINTIMLDAVPSAVPMYEKLGFIPFCRSLRLKANLKSKLKNPFVNHILDEDLSELMKFDYIQFKGDRSELLKKRFSQNKDYCFVIRRSGQIKGYLMAIPKNRHIFIGPWIVDLEEPTPHILLERLVYKKKTKIIIGILESNYKAVILLKSLSFKIFNFSVRMFLGDPYIPSNGIFAIAGPDRG
jgi:predicted N-acetyltransferase YhbS